MLLNLNRPNIRGIKKCRSCGYYNGNRSKSCKNQNCPQFLECSRVAKKSQRNVTPESPIDPISISTKDDVQYFSVRVADKVTTSNPGLRSFVKIEESTIETARNTVIICRTAVCYVDSCMTSVTNFANCKHIVECTSQCSGRQTQSATKVPVVRSKFLKFFSHLSEPERTELWDYYSTCSEHAVQQLKGNLFVVKAIPCGNKENSGGLNVNAGIKEYVHCELGYRDLGRTPTFNCSCRGDRATSVALEHSNLCHHVLLLYSAIDGSFSLRDQFKVHLDMVGERLDLHELDLFEESDLILDWDMKTDPFIENMINAEILLDQELELAFIDDLRMSDFGDFLRETDDNFLKAEQKKDKSSEDRMQWQTDTVNLQPGSGDKMSLSVSFDTILTSIIERINCNFHAWNSVGKDTSWAEEQEFVFYVHNVSGGGGAMTSQSN